MKIIIIQVLREKWGRFVYNTCASKREQSSLYDENIICQTCSNGASRTTQYADGAAQTHAVLGHVNSEMLTIVTN
jgi:hypothetical protein